MKRVLCFLLLLSICINCSHTESIKVNLSKEIVIPKTYVVYKATDPITIDGKAEESDWKNVPFTDNFIDIEGVKVPKQITKVKMLWDAEYLYIYAKLDEEHIWGNITKRDAVIYYNNDFEVFISPSNDTHNYGEIEINALGTVWDLVLNKPYNVGGKPKNKWDLKKLKSEVYIKGTLNNPNDIDEYWSVEMAIPLNSYAELKNRPKVNPKNGEQWRINFSRVQWDFDLTNGVYSRKKENNKFLPEYNWVWSNQGAVNMHLPENWGYIHFTDNKPSSPIEFQHQTDVLSEQITYGLYRKIAFKNLKNLKKEPVGTKIEFDPIKIENTIINATFLKTYTGFNLQTQNLSSNLEYRISENGLIHRRKINPTKK